jgi:hypothetical protein
VSQNDHAAPSDAQVFTVRRMTDSEQCRVRECLRWFHEQGAMWACELDDRRIAEQYAAAVVEARRRWPDVATLIGF